MILNLCGMKLDLCTGTDATEVRLFTNWAKFRVQNGHYTETLTSEIHTVTYRLTIIDPTIAGQTTDLIHSLKNLPQVNTAAVNGVARGGGNKFLTALDIRFATKTHARFGQPEVGSGIVSGAGGSQFLPGLIGRGGAMEYIRSSKDITAENVEQIGWINKAFDSEQEMDAYVDELTSRIACFLPMPFA